MQSVRRHLLATILAAGLAILASHAAFAAGSEPPAPTQPGPEVAEFLLATAAAEFRAPGALRPADLRRVRVGYFADKGPGRFLLCGEFRPVDAPADEWVTFATIQTSPYEHWLGGVAEALCASPKVQWQEQDHSADLLKRVGR